MPFLLRQFAKFWLLPSLTRPGVVDVQPDLFNPNPFDYFGPKADFRLCLAPKTCLLTALASQMLFPLVSLMHCRLAVEQFPWN